MCKLQENIQKKLIECSHYDAAGDLQELCSQEEKRVHLLLYLHIPKQYVIDFKSKDEKLKDCALHLYHMQQLKQ